MKAWERYQHETAELLRELGFDATVNDLIAGANRRHPRDRRIGTADTRGYQAAVGH